MQIILEGLFVSVTALSALVGQYTVTPIAYADAPKIEVAETNKEKAQRLARKYSDEYGISYHALWATMTCENSTYDPSLQSYHVNKKGEREESYGVAQWHIPSGNRTEDGRVITKAMAQDMELSIKTMAWYFSEGKQTKWTCYRMLFSPKGE